MRRKASKSQTGSDDSASLSTVSGDDDSSVESLLGVTSPRTKNPTRSNSRGLPLATQKQVLDDLEESGGIRYILSRLHGLREFCDSLAPENLDVYGLNNSSERVQVENKIRNWGRLTDGEYALVLQNFQLSSAQVRGTYLEPLSQEERSASKPKKANRKGSRSGTPRFGTPPAQRPASTRNLKSPTNVASPRAKTPKNLASPSRLKSPKTPQPSKSKSSFSAYREPPPVIYSSSEDERPKTKTMSRRNEEEKPQLDGNLPIGTICSSSSDECIRHCYLLFRCYLRFEDYITVDLEHLEGTRYPFQVTAIDELQDAKQLNKLHRGYVIKMRTNPVDAFGMPSESIPEFPYQAFVSKTDRNVVYVLAPLLEYPDRGGDDNRIRRRLTKHDDLAMAQVVGSFDAARHDFEERHGLKEDGAQIPRKYYRLEFPGDVKLKADILDVNRGAKEDDTFALKLYGATTKATLDAAAVKGRVHTTPRMFWMVADAAKKARTVGESEKKKKNTTVSAAAMADSSDEDSNSMY